MKIACLGGGPGGLAFAIRAKRSHPSREIEVYDRNPAGATYGFGVVLSDEAMGAIADRSGERLGASDVAIVEFRRLMIKAAREFMEGKRPPGIGVKASDYPVYGSWERIVPKGTDWRDFEPYPLKQAAE